MHAELVTTVQDRAVELKIRDLLLNALTVSSGAVDAISFLALGKVFTAFMTGGQFGLVNINLGQSSEPKVEEEVLSDIATYGKQLGRIGDALIVLIEHFHPRKPLTADETNAIDALKAMLDKIADVKEKYKRPAMRPSGGTQES